MTKSLNAGGHDGHVKIWDLRKLAQSHEIDVGSSVNSLSFDYCGTFIECCVVYLLATCFIELFSLLSFSAWLLFYICS